MRTALVVAAYAALMFLAYQLLPSPWLWVPAWLLLSLGMAVALGRLGGPGPHGDRPQGRGRRGAYPG